MSPDAETTKMLQAVLANQEKTGEKVQEIAVDVAKLRQAFAGHQDLQLLRTKGRDANCLESREDRSDLWAAVDKMQGLIQALQLALAGDRGGRSSRATVAQWTAQVVTLAIACWATVRPS